MLHHLSRIFITILLLGTSCAWAQFVVVADPRFAKDLTKMFPSVMSVDSLSIDTVAAKTISGALYFQNSTCTNVEEIKYFTGINHLQLWKCPNVSHIPNLSRSTLLTQLDLRGTKFYDLTELYPIKNQLSALWLRQISGGVMVQDFTYLNQFTPLTYLQISGFATPILPDFTSYPGLIGIHVGGNKLSFKDLIPLTNYSSFGNNLTLMPQNKQTKDTLVDVYCNDPLTLKIPIDVGVPGITYAFFKNGVMVQGYSSSNTFALNSTAEEDSGTYVGAIKSNNPYFANDSLLTGNFVVKTGTSLNCMKLFSPNGDNLDDELILEGSGEAVVRNKQGDVIKTIALPGRWDGTNTSGSPVDIGLYSISIGSKVRTVTLLR